MFNLVFDTSAPLLFFLQFTLSTSEKFSINGVNPNQLLLTFPKHLTVFGMLAFSINYLPMAFRISFYHWSRHSYPIVPCQLLSMDAIPNHRPLDIYMDWLQEIEVYHMRLKHYFKKQAYLLFLMCQTDKPFEKSAFWAKYWSFLSFWSCICKEYSEIWNGNVLLNNSYFWAFKRIVLLNKAFMTSVMHIDSHIRIESYDYNRFYERIIWPKALFYYINLKY